MIPIYIHQDAETQLQNIIALPMKSSDGAIVSRVATIIEAVQKRGDMALQELAIQFGDPCPETIELTKSDIDNALTRVPQQTYQLLERSAENIRCFAQAVMQSVQPVYLDQGMFQVGLDWKPVERVACYVPGGRYPLPSTALMTAITAQVSGVPDICIVSPAVSDIVIAAGTIAGVTQFYRVGGAQAVAACAFGTETLRPTDMLVGPGNAYVTEAKRQLQGRIGIDMLAGPSEVVLIADEQANPHWVALDMLAQAEHDPDARAYLLTDSIHVAKQVQSELSRIVAENKLPAYIQDSSPWGEIFCLETLEQCIRFANQLAPEHLELQVANPHALKPFLKHYGALFMGMDTPVPYGDYMAGPNHTLPTGRTSRFSGGLNPLTFLRPQSWIQANSSSQMLASDTAQFAQLEGLIAHGLSAKARLYSASDTI